MVKQTIVESLQSRVSALHGEISQKDIADLAGVSLSWLTKFMSGDRKSPQMDQVQALSDALDIIEG